MRQLGVAWLVAVIMLLFHLPASSGVEMPQGVVGNGGTVVSSGSHRLYCTVGQPVTGIVENPSHIHEIGFWHEYESILSAVKSPGRLPVVKYWLGQNYPNPLSWHSTLQYSVPKPSHVRIRLFDVNGREVRRLLDEQVDCGCHTVRLDSRGLSSGVYFCRMEAGRFIDSRRIVVLR
jgi:hypothetical protein